MDEDREPPSPARPAQRPAGEPGPVKSATRVLDLLEFLARWGAVRSHSEIAEELTIPKSSLTQLLRTLVQRGYIRYVSEEKGYRLGPAIAALADRASGESQLLDAAGAALDLLSHETGESCALNLLKGDQSEVVACRMSSLQRLVIHMKEGDVAPLYATSGGKALLAFMPADALASYLARVDFEPITANTIRSGEALVAELEEVRIARMAYVREEFTPGIAGIAAPILSATDFPLGSINVAIPVSRYNEDVRRTCEDALRRATRLLTQRLTPNL